MTAGVHDAIFYAIVGQGVYFGVDETGMDQMMSDIAGMGGELFVMDDGWFGDKYPRNNDSIFYWEIG